MTSERNHLRNQQRETWDRFAGGWKSWDSWVVGWLAPVGEAMIRHAELRDGSDVLDVATGTGEPGLSAAALVPQGRVTLSDLAEGMLAVASEKAAQRGLRNVTTQECDAGALPFADASFDAVLCRFGFMFFPDVAAAAAEFARVVRPGGRVSAAVWGKPANNAWATTIMSTISRHVATPAVPPDAPGLFRCAPDGHLSAVFVDAGLTDVTEEEVSFEMVHDTPERYWSFMTDVAAPVVAGLSRADLQLQETIRAEVLKMVQPDLSDARVHLRSTATVVSGYRATEPRDRRPPRPAQIPTES
ncbi:MAG: methyltransferase domain-containing protein [Nakamurella sp.]